MQGKPTNKRSGADDTRLHAKPEDHQRLDEWVGMGLGQDVEEGNPSYEQEWELVRSLQEDEQRLQSVKVALRAYLQMHPDAWEQYVENIVLGMALSAEYEVLDPSGVEIAEAMDLILEEEVPEAPGEDN